MVCSKKDFRAFRVFCGFATALIGIATGLSAFADVSPTEVTFFTPEIVRIVKRPPGAMPLRDSFAVIAKPQDVSVAVSDENDTKVYSSSALRVVVDADGNVRFETRDGKPLLRECGYSFKKRSDGGPDAESFVVSQSWRLGADEPVYGLGIWQDESISRLGKKKKMYQENPEDCVPILQSVRGWGLFWDNSSPLDYCEDGGVMTFGGEVGDAIDYYFMYGGTSDGVVRQIRWLTGEVPMQPKWTLGYYISRERYKSWAEAIDVVRGHRRRGIPLDCVVQDWQYWGDDAHWNAMDFLVPGFSDPKRNVAEIHSLHAKLMLSVWQSFGPETAPYRELREKGLYLKGGFDPWPRDRKAIAIDAFSEEARGIYWRHLERLGRVGVDAWWMDHTEPCNYTKSRETFDAPTGMGSLRRMCNAYPFFAVKGVYERQRAADAGRRRVSIMTRSAYAGQQRFGANVWSGDVSSRWKNLRKQIAAGISFGLTGNPNYNTDIGGFFAHPWKNHEGGILGNPGFAKLNVRWMQYGLFNPIFRSHGKDAPREIWSVGECCKEAYDAMFECVRLRYRLLPYLYSTAWWVSALGGTWMRPLFAENPDDHETWNISDQFLFGTELMAAPVVEENVVKRRLYLPQGTWFEFFTGERVEGGKWIERPVSLETIPLYAKAGAIVPTGPVQQYVDEISNPVVEIRVFPGADGVFTLYDDAGDGYGYEKGELSEIPLKWDDAKQTLTIGERRGSYPGMNARRTFPVVVRGESQTVEYDGKESVVAFRTGNSSALPDSVALIPRPTKLTALGGFTTNDTIRYSFDGSIPTEGYRMKISDDGISVETSDEAGRFYAQMTLRQLKCDGGYPKVCIEDAPRFHWRGVHLDDVRHFFGKETVKRLIDQMSWYKFNVFHWHLTDMQAWLIDIPGFPKLVKQGKGKKFGEKVGPFYYTVADVKEIVEYARARHITVVPEVEFPGHFNAMVRAYPGFACPNGGKVMCIGNPEAVQFAEKVLDHVCELFQSEVVHFGGDECPRASWKTCPKCRERIRREGLRGVDELQPWLTRHLTEYLAKKGRRAIGWDEIFDGAGGLPKGTMGMCWRTEGAGAAAANAGHKIVRCPTSHCYFDYGQGLKDDPFVYFGSRKGRTVTLEKAYSFDPLEGVLPEALQNVAGGQCCNWSECTYNRFDLEWKLWPRGFALAEVLWTYPDPKKRDFAEFAGRAEEHRRRLVRDHVNCASL